MSHYAIVTDLNRCVGCLACNVACKAMNGVQPGSFWSKTLRVGPNPKQGGSGQFPDVEMYFLTMQCQHCANPECVSICPTGASSIAEDGTVQIDRELCIGCEACMTACPYEGVRTHVSSEPSWYLDVVVGEADAPSHPGNTVEKCTFCRNLTSRGEVPACMQLCPGRARAWGDLDDPDSEASQLLASRESMRLKEDAGTSPSVYYLV